MLSYGEKEREKKSWDVCTCVNMLAPFKANSIAVLDEMQFLDEDKDKIYS